MKKIILIFIAMLPFLFSCEDFLEEVPKSQLSSSNFYNNKSEAEAAILGVYNQLLNGAAAIPGGEFAFTLYDASDNYVAKNSGSDESVQMLTWEKYSPGEGRVEQFYRTSMTRIAPCNAVIAGIETSGLTADLKNKFIAEAKFVRAFMYLSMVQLWGGVPIIDFEVTNAEDAAIKQSTEAEVFDFIIEDLKFASTPGYLPSKKAGENPTIRAWREAALFLLAKAYLYSGEYELAAEAIKPVIDAPFSLQASYTDIFKDMNEGNSESIYELQHSDAFGRGAYTVFATWWISPAIVKRGWGGFFQISDDLYNLFTPEDDRKNMCLKEVDVKQADGSYETVSLAAGNNPDATNRYSFKHISDLQVETPNKGYDERGTGKNMIVMRLGEAKLIYAEAVNEAPDAFRSVNLAQATQQLNDLRSRAGVTTPVAGGLSKEAFRTAVRLERRLELYDEYSRRYDLKRYGILTQTMKKRYDYFNERSEYLPFPAQAILRNPNLVQNTGY